MEKSIAVFGIVLGALLALLSFNSKKVKTSFVFNRSTFSDLLGEMESTNNYTIENSIGALGKYQFMPSTLEDLHNRFNLPEWKPKESFLSNPSLQETYFSKHLDNVLTQIENDSTFKDFVGTIVRGRKRFPSIVTPANYYGFVAGSHLAGVGGCKKFVLGIKDADDGRTSVSDYVSYFSYNLT
jgi:hypothetical protein